MVDIKNKFYEKLRKDIGKLGFKNVLIKITEREYMRISWKETKNSETIIYFSNDFSHVKIDGASSRQFCFIFLDLIGLLTSEYDYHIISSGERSGADDHGILVGGMWALLNYKSSDS